MEALKNTLAAAARDRKASSKPQGGRCVARGFEPRCARSAPLTWLSTPRRTAAAKLENAITSQNESYLNNQTDQQALLIRHATPRATRCVVVPCVLEVSCCRRQDEDLDELSESVARLGNVGLTIGEELDAQGKMLEELEEDVDGTTTRLAAAQRKLTQVIKKSGMGGQIAIIICLIITLVVLMVIAVN